MTFMIWKPRGLLKDIGRVQGRSFQDINFVTKAISPRTESFSDEENPLESSVLTWLDDNKEIKNPAIKLDGIKKQRGIHASGMVLTPTKLEDWVPIAYMTERGSDEKKPVVVSEWDMYALEDLQILKIDLLGLKTLDVIDLCIKRINKKEIKIKDIWKECLDDLENPEIYKMISSGRILGLFQLETSEGMAKLIKDMQPHCFDDIVLALALYRTAIIRAGMLDEYIKRRNGADFEYLHPSLKPILESTYGILIYQEELMEIGVKCAGMTPSESDNFRKATKLKDLEKFKSWQDRFVKGCVKNGFEEDIANELWEWCVKWSGYGFNKNHSVAYSLLTYVTAWLKFYYPLEFMSSAMSFDIDDETIIEKYISECRKMKIKVVKPDINRSYDKYVIRKKKLVSPITNLDKVGNKVYEVILNARKEKKFESFDDFYDRIDKRVVNVRIVTNLILGGCFSKIEESIEELFDRFIEDRNDNVYRQLFCSDCEKRYPCNIKKSESEGTFCPNCGSAEVVFDILSMKGKKFNKPFLMNSIYGFSSQENPLKRYVDVIVKHDVGSISELVSPSIEEGTMYKIAAHVKRIKLHIDKRGGEMAFVDLSDGEDDVSLVIFASDWGKIKEEIAQGNCYIISALKNRGGLLYLGRNKTCKIIKLGL
jgi:DNA polymerase-3 subunit alpha